MYVDSAAERKEREARSDFVDRVEAARIGYLTARDKKAFRKWQTKSKHPDASTTQTGEGLTGLGLERAVAVLARTNPEYVTFRP